MKKLHLLALPLIFVFINACQPEQQLIPEENDWSSEEEQFGPNLSLTGDLENDLSILGLKDVAQKQGKLYVLQPLDPGGLAGAITTAGVGGTVLVLPGDYEVNGTIEIDQQVTIIGTPGATIRSNTQILGVINNAQPCLWVHNADHVTISGLDFRPTGSASSAGTAIVLENAEHCKVVLNDIRDFQVGVVMEQADHSEVSQNTIVNLAPGSGGIHAIMVVNAEHAKVSHNDISNAVFGVWACDKKGRFNNNYLHGNAFGLVLCKVPDATNPTNSLPLYDPSVPSGFRFIGAEVSALEWNVRNNHAESNDWGYIVIDGATSNKLINNKATTNAVYDIELAGPSNRFGFFTPTSANNRVVAGQYKNLVVKDCGSNNIIVGYNSLVDTSVDLCF